MNRRTFAPPTDPDRALTRALHATLETDDLADVRADDADSLALWGAAAQLAATVRLAGWTPPRQSPTKDLTERSL